MKYKKVSEAPKELEQLIELVNLLPTDLERFEKDLSDLSTTFNRDYLEIFRKHDNKLALDNELLANDINKTASNFSKKLRQLITPKLADLIGLTIERVGFENAKFRLRRLINEKTTLLTIIDSLQVFKEFNNPDQTFNFAKAMSAFSFNADSTVTLSSFEVLEILTRNKIPIERMRICRICKNIFWAKRIESPTCSEKCGNTFNGRKTRIKGRLKKYEKEFTKEREKLKKQKAILGKEHPSISKQMALLDKLQNKIITEQVKYGTL